MRAIAASNVGSARGGFCAREYSVGQSQMLLAPATSHRETDLCPVLPLGPGPRSHAQGNRPVQRRA